MTNGKRKKVGIVSLYHNNRNYGGQLQAYALTRYISELGYDAEQICWQAEFKRPPQKKRELKKIFHYIYVFCWLQVKKVYKKLLNNKLESRKRAFERFQEEINHSEKCYTGKDFLEDCKNYDAIIIGSDQVWNTNWYGTQYFLDFVPNDVCKFSYAASMPDVNISDEMKNTVKSALEGFSSISVREKKTADFLTELTGKKVRHVIDPTLLLDPEQWDDIASKKIVSEKYIFCYFLGRNKHYRKYARLLAKKTGLKIVSLPHLCGVAREDLNFADINLYDVVPGEFVSLIKNAEYVLTDSFHATVFSNLYKVKYFVFDRQGIDMSERIVTLLDIFNSRKRFLKTEQGMDDMLNMIGLEANTDFTKFHTVKKISENYIKESI